MAKKTNKSIGLVQENVGPVVNTAVAPSPVEGVAESVEEISVRRPQNRKIASSMNVRRQKMRKRESILTERKDKRAILNRGYYIQKINGEVKHLPLDAADREYLLAKIADLNLQIKKVNREIKDYTHSFKSRSKRAKQAYRRDLVKVNEKERIKRESMKIMEKVEKVLNEENISTYPQLSAIITGDENAPQALTELERFFSANLTAEFNKFRTDSKLKQEIFVDTLKYVKEISQ
ncbi:MAG: hypothetical protein IPM14_00995 [bacterium]|nr:hypothetical protein [bacterium]